MQRSAKSVFVFGIYAGLMGGLLLFIPTVILPVFGLGLPSDYWVRLLGFVLCCSAYYYIRAALSGNKEFIRLTIHTRFAAPLVVFGLILSSQADLSIIPFGIIDGLGGLWTMVSLKNDSKQIHD